MFPSASHRPASPELAKSSAGVRVPALNHVFQRGAENTSPVYRKTAGESLCVYSVDSQFGSCYALLIPINAEAWETIQ